MTRQEIIERFKKVFGPRDDRRRRTNLLLGFASTEQNLESLRPLFLLTIILDGPGFYWTVECVQNYPRTAQVPHPRPGYE